MVNQLVFSINEPFTCSLRSSLVLSLSFTLLSPLQTEIYKLTANNNSPLQMSVPLGENVRSDRGEIKQTVIISRSSLTYKSSLTCALQFSPAGSQHLCSCGIWMCLDLPASIIRAELCCSHHITASRWAETNDVDFLLPVVESNLVLSLKDLVLKYNLRYFYFTWVLWFSAATTTTY